MTEETDVKKMKVAELKSALAKRGLSTDGLKVDLQHRLQARLDEEEFGIVEAPPPAAACEAASAAADDYVAPTAATAVVEEEEEEEEEKPVAGGSAVPAGKDGASAEAGTSVAEGEEGEAADAGGGADGGGAGEVAPKASPGMSFKERMELRAKRFGIQPPPADKAKKAVGGGVKATGGVGVGGPNKKLVDGNKGKKEGGGAQINVQVKQPQQKQLPPAGNKRKEGGVKEQEQKKQKVVVAMSTPLLPKDEIEKRLARAAKYGTTEGVDELKAQLRKHRFSSV